MSYIQCADRANRTFIRTTTVGMITLAMLFAHGIAFAQTNTPAYAPPVLKAPFTLVYTARVNRPAQSWLKDVGQSNLDQVGRVTVSSNGRDFLYSAEFGKWKSVDIIDMTTGTSYVYDSSVYEATVFSGAYSGLSRMLLLPFPGLGYDIYPMLHPFTYSPDWPFHWTMACLGTTGLEENGVIKSMNYRPATVTLITWGKADVVSNCTIMIPLKRPLEEEYWQFSQYRMLRSVPIATTIDRDTTAPARPGVWPIAAVRPEGHIRYTLVTASQTSLPDREYRFESVLPAGYAVADYRKSQ